MGRVAPEVIIEITSRIDYCRSKQQLREPESVKSPASKRCSAAWASQAAGFRWWVLPAEPLTVPVVPAHISPGLSDEDRRTRDPHLLAGLREQRTGKLHRPVAGLDHRRDRQPGHRDGIDPDKSDGVIASTDLDLHEPMLASRNAAWPVPGDHLTDRQ
jgi:hypothetical protein